MGHWPARCRTMSFAIDKWQKIKNKCVLVIEIDQRVGTLDLDSTAN